MKFRFEFECPDDMTIEDFLRVKRDLKRVVSRHAVAPVKIRFAPVMEKKRKERVTRASS